MAQKLAALNRPRILRDMASPIKTYMTIGIKCFVHTNVVASKGILIVVVKRFSVYVSHLYGRKWRNREKLGHPKLKVETEAVEKGPDVNQFTRAEP